MYTDIFLGLIIVAVILLGYFSKSCMSARYCVNCKQWCSKHEGVNMSDGFVCSTCLYKTAAPLPDEEDGWKEHAEAHYAAEEHERQRQEFMDTMHRNGIPIEDWFVDTIDEKEDKP